MKHLSPITCFSQSNQTLISASEDGIIKIWDLNYSKCIQAITLTEPISDLKSFKNLIYAASGASIHCFDINQNHLFQSVDNAVFSVSESTEINGIDVENEFIASCNDDGAVALYDLKTGKSTCTFKQKHSSIASTICIQPNSNFIWSGNGKFDIYIDIKILIIIC